MFQVASTGMRGKRANATAVVNLRVQRIHAEWDAAAWHPIVGGTIDLHILDFLH